MTITVLPHQLRPTKTAAGAGRMSSWRRLGGDRSSPRVPPGQSTRCPRQGEWAALFTCWM